MISNDLTDAERVLIDGLPKPPIVGSVLATNVWIIEWLPLDERQTGLALHEWMEKKRHGWSIYSKCGTKDDVIAAVDRATIHAQRFGMIPVLHLEAHGGQYGLEGPNGNGSNELLRWDELIDPFQRLNLATRCNLVIFVAACTGFAAVQTLTRGPLAPAVAIVGPDAPIEPRDLLSGTQEFYRRWLDKNPRLKDLAESASQQAGVVDFEVEPFVVLAHEAMTERLVISMRPEEQRRRIEKIRQRMLSETGLPAPEIERRLAQIPSILPANELQRLWDQMFMIDLYPENRDRFGIDMGEVVKLVSRQLVTPTS